MSIYNTPAGETPVTTQQPARRKKDPRYIIYALLTTGLIASLGYIWYNKTQEKDKDQQQEQQIMASNTKATEAETDYKAALIRLDSITSLNTSLNAEITSKDGNIAKLRQEIDQLIREGKKDDRSIATLNDKIRQLNSEISTFRDRVAALEEENSQLTAENTIVKTERDQVKTELVTTQDNLAQTNVVKQQLEAQVDVGSTLHASNFKIVGIKEKSSGKEKESDKAKKVDKLRISFDLDENRITQSGMKDIYVAITAPDGTPVTVEALGSGTFTTREEGDKFFTNKIAVDYTQGQKKSVQFDWKQNSAFQKGTYKVQVYQNGFQIGSGSVDFKKSGFLGL